MPCQRGVSTMTVRGNGVEVAEVMEEGRGSDVKA